MTGHKTLKDALAEGYTENVIKTLKELTHNLPTFNNDVVLLSSRFGQYRQKKNRGTQSDATLTVELNQIHDSLLDIINQLPQSDFDMTDDKDNLKDLVKSLYDLIKDENNIQSITNINIMDFKTAIDGLWYVAEKARDGFFETPGSVIFSTIAKKLFPNNKKGQAAIQEIQADTNTKEAFEAELINFAKADTIFANQLKAIFLTSDFKTLKEDLESIEKLDKRIKRYKDKRPFVKGLEEEKLEDTIEEFEETRKNRISKIESILKNIGLFE